MLCEDEDEDIAIFLKDILPLMSVDDIVGCLVLKLFQNKKANKFIIRDIVFNEKKYDVLIKKR